MTIQVGKEMGLVVGELLIKYLGLSVGAIQDPKIWTPKVVVVKKRLTTWQKNYLSMEERLTLIKSILANLPISNVTL